MKLRLLLMCVSMFAITNLAWSGTIAIKEKDKTPGYIFFFNRIYIREAPNGYVLVPSIMASNQWDEARPFPVPVSTPYEVKLTNAGVAIGKPLEKWPKTDEAAKCIWYVHKNGTFKYLGKSPIHYGNLPQGYYCEPIKK